MSWAVGYDTSWHRDVGYGVPALCDKPGCETHIDRGLAHVCGNAPFGGENGCGRYYCGDHLGVGYDENAECPHEADGDYISPDLPEWIDHKLTDPSWEQWRNDEPDEVAFLRLGGVS